MKKKANKATTKRKKPTKFEPGKNGVPDIPAARYLKEVMDPSSVLSKKDAAIVAGVPSGDYKSIEESRDYQLLAHKYIPDEALFTTLLDGLRATKWVPVAHRIYEEVVDHEARKGFMVEGFKLKGAYKNTESTVATTPQTVVQIMQNFLGTQEIE